MAIPATGATVEEELMKMTRPLSATFLLARCIVMNAPRTLISTKRSICSSLSSTIGTQLDDRDPLKFDAGVGHDDVEGPEPLLSLGEEAVDVPRLGDVGLDCDRLCPMFAHF